ncbi:MAG: hypothetical protein ACSLFI_08495 [Solirubrobacterales bacterium]
MDVKNAFLAFGLCLAALAVIVTVIGMRKENFPGRGVMSGLLVLAVFLVGGTAFYAVKLAQHEQEEREHGEHPVGEEASVSPVVIPARF